MFAGFCAQARRRRPVKLPDGLTGDRLRRLAEEHGTPLYVTSGETVRARAREVREAFPEAEICYAAKANGNPHLLRLLRSEGARVDAVSLGEVTAAERAGFAAEEIVYTGVFPPDDELAAVARRGVRINANCGADLERLAGEGATGEVGLRVNPLVGAGHHAHVVTGGPGAKFGVPLDRAADAYGRGRELGLPVTGLHMHIGSGIRDPEPVLEGVEVLAGLVRRLRSRGRPVELVDVGGGWGVPYRPGEAGMDVGALADGVRARLPDDVRLAVEPGRYLVAESTVLLTRVTAVEPPFVGVDAGMNTHLRPALYDAYHHVSSLEEREGPERTVHVVGPICETADVLGRDRVLPDPRAGDLLAVHTVGAYGSVMASRYNGRPLPGEVLVDGGEARVIRRAESREDLFRHVPGPEGG